MAELIDDTEVFTIALTPPHVPDLMPGQTCVGPDLHQLITGGMIGDLIEANSPKCIGVEPVPPEDKGIFGDLDTKWIIIAVIALIILGLLT